MKQMFDISEKLVSEQDEISNVDTIGWEKHSWKHLSLIGDEQIINLQRTKVYVFSDSLLRFGKMNVGRKMGVAQMFTGIQNLGLNWWWANGIRVECLPRIQYVASSPQSSRFTVKIGWNMREFYRKDHLHVDVQRHLMGIERQQERMRFKCSTRFSICKKIWCKTMVISRSWFREKWYSISEDSPQSEWDKMAEKMMETLAESGHPVSQATSTLSRGQLKSKDGAKMSIHYCADQDTITMVFRTITSVNQLSLYGAVAEMCEEYESFHDRTVKPVLGRQSSSSFVPSVIKTNVPLNSDDILLTKNFCCNNMENELTNYHNKTDWSNFVWMQDSWMLLKSDNTSWR